jgi:hypothetical protein
MLEIAKLNSETSNNNIRLIAAMLTINIVKLAAAALVIPIIATPLKLIAFIVFIAAAPLKRNAYKAIRSYTASSAS